MVMFTLVINIFYSLLYLLKRVELQLNPMYDSKEEILFILLKQKKIEIFFIVLNSIMTALTIVVWLYYHLSNNHSDERDIKRAVCVVWFAQCAMCFLLNMYLIGYFFRMIMYYAEELGPKDPDQLWKLSVSKAIIIIITVIFIVA